MLAVASSSCAIAGIRKTTLRRLRAASPRFLPLKTPWPWTSPWAVPPTPSCIFWRWRRRPRCLSILPRSTPSRARCLASARWRPTIRCGTWKTSIAPAEFSGFWENSIGLVSSIAPCPPSSPRPWVRPSTPGTSSAPRRATSSSRRRRAGFRLRFPLARHAAGRAWTTTARPVACAT